MALARVVKIKIIGHRKDQYDIIEALQDAGVVHVQEQNGDLKRQNVSQQLAEVDYQLAGVKFSINFLSSFDTEKKKILDKLTPPPTVRPSDIHASLKRVDHGRVTEQVQNIEGAINRAHNLSDKLLAEKALIAPWQKLTFIPNPKLLQSQFTFTCITLPAVQKHSYDAALQKQLPLAHTEIIDRIKETKAELLHALTWCRLEEKEKLNQLLNDLDIATVELPLLEVTIKERIEQISQELTQLTRDIEEQHKQAQKLTDHLPALKIIHDYLTWRQDQLKRLTQTGMTEQTFSLTGWIDEGRIMQLEKQLQKVTNDIALERLTPDQDEEPPVALKNSWAKDFESITGLYGSPKGTDPDPSPFLAPFFVLFFGMAMTDAGYGLLLALGIFAAIKLLKIPRESQKLLRVLLWGGLATFILGVVTGGWFSIDLSLLPAPISQALLSFQLIDPIKNPLFIFYFSLALGVTQVLTGLIIDTIWKIKHHQVLDGIFGSGAWLLTIVGLLLFAGGTLGTLPIIAPVGKWLAFTGVAALVYNGTRKTKNIFLKPGLGLLSLYGMVGYFSDVLSYSRLLALGLTTTIIGTVVNIIAALVFAIPYVGWLAALVVLIGGHAFNIAINALGAFIHSARLQFIEFFPKFLEAGGEPFEPFKKDFKYVRLINH